MKKLLCLLFLFIFMCFSCSGAYAESLYIRTNKSYVEPGSFYELSVFSSLVPFVGYTGLLDVNVTSCNQANACTTTTVPWGNYQVNNGSIRLDIATNYTPGYFRARFKPRGSTWDWSNEIQVNVGMTQGLENAQNYWLLPSTPVEYTGTNFADNKDFKTVIGYKPPTPLCGETSQTMYFMKNDPSGYWDPHVPWYDSIRGGSGYANKNLLWHLVPWQKKDSWKAMGYDDEYLTSIGHGRFTYNPADPFNLSTNFQPSLMTVQDRYEFPNYLLSPKWVGAGWGIGVDSRNSGPRTPNESFCSIPMRTDGEPGTWSVQVNFVDLNLPNYQGPALQYKFYEGPHGFVSDSTKLGLREDWYFVKNIGLIKIEAKYFGPDSRIKSCLEDADCLMNETMVSPHIRLIRSDLLAPTPTTVPCTDSDNGKIYTVKGNTCQGTDCRTDACNSVGIVEYYCNNNQVDHENLSCGTGKTCSDGKCVVVPTNTPVPPTATPTIILGDFNGIDGVTQADFGYWKTRYLAVPPTMTLVDFGVWKTAYLK